MLKRGMLYFTVVLYLLRIMVVWDSGRTAHTNIFPEVRIFLVERFYNANFINYWSH